MIPIPDYHVPEQYKIANGSDWLRVLPKTDRGNSLDKWCFVKRDENTLVLEKHIGGEKYRASHSVPDGIPEVVRDKLVAKGYTIVEPKSTYRVLAERKHNGDVKRSIQVEVDEDGNILDELSERRQEKVEQLS